MVIGMGITAEIIRLHHSGSYDFAATFFDILECTSFDEFVAAMKGRKLDDNVVHTREFMARSSDMIDVTEKDIERAMEEW